jgi:predicted transcriptional regulator of viral defense system
MKKEKKIIKLVEEKGIIRVKEVESLNISRQYLYRLVRRGILEKVNRGMYKIKNRKFPDDEMLLILTKKINNFTICLLSALQYYNMTTQNPSQIWVAVKNNYRIPKINIPIKINRFSGKSLTSGRKKVKVGNMEYFIYNSAKTVCDCFKFRNKIGLDIAIEALKAYIKDEHGDINELWKFAKIDRVERIIKPYIYSLLNE